MLFTSHLRGMCNFDFFYSIAFFFVSLSLTFVSILMAKNILKIQYTVEMILNDFPLMIFQNKVLHFLWYKHTN